MLMVLHRAVPLSAEAETLLENTFDYVSHNYLTNKNVKNVRLCWVFADPVTNVTTEFVIYTIHA